MARLNRSQVAVGFDAQSRLAHGSLVFTALFQAPGQFAPQAGAGHLQDVADAGLAQGRLEVLAGAAMQVENIALGR